MSEWISQSQGTFAVQEHCRFVARQPILDRCSKTFGYELLFRDSWENRFSADGDVASRHMIDNAVAFGMDSLVGEKIPFINCTRELLLRGIPTLLPRNTVLEILETVQVDEALVKACRSLRTLGYALALDDYDFSEQWAPLLPYAAYIKIDFRASDSAQRLKVIRSLRFLPVKFIAEKIETEAEHQLAANEGFHYFQGYFFTKPIVLGRPALTAVINRLRFMAELSRASFDRERMLRLIKEEPTISYRLLRMANSAATALREPLTSLNTALAMIGEDQFRKMALTALASEVCGKQGLETLRYTLSRARFCELMADRMGLNPMELYLFGMVSVVRSTLSLTTEDLEGTVNLRPEMLQAIAGADNMYGTLLTLTNSFEKGNWDEFSVAADRLCMSEDDIATDCTAARQWAEEILSVL